MGLIFIIFNIMKGETKNLKMICFWRVPRENILFKEYTFRWIKRLVFFLKRTVIFPIFFIVWFAPVYSLSSKSSQQADSEVSSIWHLLPLYESCC